jgi:hypothetical protein
MGLPTYLSLGCMMRKGLLLGTVAVVHLLMASAPATAGLTVSLTVNGNQVSLTPLFPNSGTPDNNDPDQNGLVVVAGLAYNVDGDSRPDLFIDTLSVFANKTTAEGILETINVVARVLGSQTVEVIVEVFDDFALPVTAPNTPMDITSSFGYVNEDLATQIKMESFLDNQGLDPLIVDSASDIPVSDTGLVTTQDFPFELRNKFTFSLRPNEKVAFKAETSAALAAAGSTAHAPEPASLLAWSFVIALAGLIYTCKRRRRA